MRRLLTFGMAIACLNLLFGAPAQSQTNSYKQTNLVSDSNPQPAIAAAHKDANLVNPWGIAFFPGAPFWISDNASPAGVTTLYDQTGTAMGSFTIPPPNGSSNPATPTGIVANLSGAGFPAGGNASQFIFDTEDGTISGWTGGASAILVIDNSKNPTAAMGAVYKGLALFSTNSGAFLLATNFRSGKVEVYDSNFKPATLSGDFSDPNPPAVPTGVTSPGYAPFGIHVVTVGSKQLVAVTYALQDPTDSGSGPNHDPIHMAGAGFVDFYNLDGTMNERVTIGGKLNAPWGVVIPPAGFGAFAGDLLVGNFGDGTINAFNLQNGNAFVDQMKDSNGAAITNLSLWDMVFGGGGQSGDQHTMYITAGLSSEMHGVFAAITANSGTPATPDFSITAPSNPVTISAGNSGMFNVTLAGLNGFNSSVSLTCSGAPNGSTCTVNPSSVTPPSGGTVTATVSIATSSNPYSPATIVGHSTATGMTGALLPVAAIALFIFLAAGFIRKQRLAGLKWTSSFAFALGLFLVSACLLAASGCGYNKPSGTGNGTQRGTTTVTITGTSGNLSHSASVTVTVQ